MPERDEVLLVIRETIAKHLEIDVAQVTEDSTLFELPNVDSLKALRGAMEIEARYGITFDPSQVLVARTVGELTDLVLEMMLAGAS